MGIPDAILHNKSRWNEPLDILCGHSTRYAFTTLGTEWGRDQIGANVWANVALKNADDFLKRGRNVIIDNVRFPNEFDLMEERGAAFIAMYRPDVDADLTHSSEKHIARLQERCQHGIANIKFVDSVFLMRKILEKIILT